MIRLLLVVALVISCARLGAFAGVSYYSQISGDIAGTTFDPSDVIGTRLGASLAVTPVTSPTAGLSISFLTDTLPEIYQARSLTISASVDLGFNTPALAKDVSQHDGAVRPHR